ncbi:murein hydrolase activator EnvC family protein [Flavobacterium psychrophilum]|uniref:murein hydrolase activator EnvC family protein n=1 Tax=Flavobacterium psychrophilum TaxID=96345 RepID=UPI00106D002C|nr:peptidoglycan DD-metalloendopeptidase family protein [Flavobacterium psychrophilum]MCB5989408.1 peptidoglycan DD-metalloendopeptidase family protein [Flavobacterium psychrophilum]MCB6053525.1 peptidoglycan DD-metalloendopeptidase family protein [Flavobacterium psychrophilum]MCB6057275.1 peptidoglycan DD-metalloendopeptidase family protein [Flavobacterium psychrophilum]MCB6084179.1 peptidoglycan DD-metalloendopeptidase family protein [Flavobacterium psychrophilum]QRE49659.1 peptidoglycan DD-
MLKYIIFFLLILSTSLSWGQEEERQRKLEQQKERLQEEIRAQEKLLQSQKTKEKSVVKVVIQQTEKINLQQKLINTTAKQAKVLGNSMYINQVSVNKLNDDLRILREDYAKMIVKSYKSRSAQSKAMFLLSSENFLQAYKRAQYMKQYSSFRKLQGEEIKVKTIELERYNSKLSGQKKEKVKLIAESEKEKEALEKDKEEQQRLLFSIKKDKGKIIADIRKKQKESKAIEKQIDRLIRESIAAANKKAGNTTNTTTFVLTPEAKELANDFKSNRGRLPWPVEKGLLTKKFGRQPHPLEPSIMIESSGIEISSERGVKARSVFAGEVSDVQQAANGTATIVLRHGDYITTYSNIGKVFVHKGDKVSTKQVLGEVFFNTFTNKAILKFLIFQNTTKLNPQSWITNM